MRTMYQYRVTVNAAERITDSYPGEQWTRIAEAAEARGGVEARLERRLVTGADFLALLADGWEARGYRVFGDMVVCPWEIMAEVRG